MTEKASGEDEPPDCVLPRLEDDCPFAAPPGPPPDAVCAFAGDATVEAEGAIVVTAAALFGSSVAAVNGDWTADVTELETACRASVTKLCFCAASGLVAVEIALASSKVDGTSGAI